MRLTVTSPSFLTCKHGVEMPTTVNFINTTTLSFGGLALVASLRRRRREQVLELGRDLTREREAPRPRLCAVCVCAHVGHRANTSERGLERYRRARAGIEESRPHRTAGVWSTHWRTACSTCTRASRCPTGSSAVGVTMSGQSVGIQVSQRTSTSLTKRWALCLARSLCPASQCTSVLRAAHASVDVSRAAIPHSSMVAR